VIERECCYRDDFGMKQSISAGIVRTVTRGTPLCQLGCSSSIAFETEPFLVRPGQDAGMGEEDTT
jgi:hypothetical protein